MTIIEKEENEIGTIIKFVGTPPSRSRKFVYKSFWDGMELEQFLNENCNKANFKTDAIVLSDNLKTDPHRVLISYLDYK